MATPELRNAQGEQRSLNSLYAELRPTQLLRSAAAGGILFVLEFIVLVSFSALIYAGTGGNLIAYGLGLVLVGNAVFITILTLVSSYGGTIAIGQDAPTAVLAGVGATVLAAIAADNPGTEWATLVMLILISTVATGLFFILLGVFKLGRFIRFLPYPVMGGFLAGTGMLLLIGAIGVMTNQPLSPALLRPSVLLYWLPGVLLALALLFALRRISNPLALPIAVLGATLIFYLITWISGLSFAELNAQGWLLGEFPTGSLWQFPLSPGLLAAVDWGVVAANLASLLPVPIVCVIALLLNANGLELNIGRDIDLNRELLGAGVANLAGGLTGGIAGYHAISLSTLNHEVSGGSRLPSLIIAGLMILTVFVGSAFLGYLPLVILGALLAYLGLSFLYRWVYQAYFTLPTVDFLVLLLITAVIVWRGFLAGIAVGLIAAVAIFIVNYSRSRVIKHTLTGTTYRSRVTRSPAESAALDAAGDQLVILQLQGFIFFGTANGLLEQVRSRVLTNETRFVVLDFRQVYGLDSTAMLSFDKLVHLARQRGFTLVLTGLSPLMRGQFARAGIAEEAGVTAFMPDLDRGVEWAEEQVCRASVPEDAEHAQTLTGYLQAIVPGEAATRLVGYLEPRQVAAGEYLIRQGDAPDDLYFIESGQVTAQLDTDGGSPVRLETMRGGRSVGELGFYLGTQRSASIVADRSSVVYRLTQAKLAEIEETDPAAAYAFHRIIVHLLGERVLHLVRAVDALQR